MSDSVNFKFGSTIEGKDIADNDLVVINEGIADGGDERYGSIYKGDKIVGTTKADSLYTTDTITVTGVNVGNLTNGLEIEAGKSIMDILRQMLMKELGVTATKPKATISGDSSRIVEKGEVVSGKTYTVTYTNGKYTGVSGYDYTMAAKCDISNVTWFGVSGVHSDDNLTVNAEDIVVTDKVEIYAQVSYDADSASEAPVTNFGNPITTGLIGAGTATTSKITYTPYLKWFVGSSKSKYEDTKWDTSLVKEGLTIAENWESTTEVNAIFPIAAKQQVIAVPSDYTISVANKSGDNLTEMFSITTTVEVTCGGTHKENYTLYIAPANAGLAADSAEMVITIKK